jgi:hypothetical protein
MNLRKQVEPLGDAALQASSNRGMHTTRPSRLTWVKRWLKRAYRITRKAGSFINATRILIPAGRGGKRPCGLVEAQGHRASGGHQDPIDQLLQFTRALGNLAVPCAVRLPNPEEFVGDVQCRQNGQAQRVATRRAVSGRGNLLVDVAGKPEYVLRIQRAADWIPLPVNFDREDATLRHLDFQCVELLEHLADA